MFRTHAPAELDIKKPLIAGTLAMFALAVAWVWRPRQQPTQPIPWPPIVKAERAPSLDPVDRVDPTKPETSPPDEFVAAIPDETRKRPSGRSRLLTAILLGAGVLVFALGIWARVADLRFNTVVSNSMRPTFSAGDVVITQPISVDALRVGDVMAFIPPNGNEPVIHRIVSIDGGVISTRGDANSADDQWRLVPTSATAYRLFAVIPLLGWVTRLEQPLLLLAALFACLALLQTIWKGVVARRRIQPQPQS